ncbi:GTP pyrophosphokinase [Yersinia kristensenii]|uniref:GTP pyrophosphokinase n=2 Tax=Yersinia TaxID=629 RepID=UPI0005E9BA22|nr:RelA/SpoT domain-containing protein [Yersinia kristensenii]CNK96935.1 Uncharacterized protein conserved in bacteria [Yersinia kristensenii]
MNTNEFREFLIEQQAVFTAWGEYISEKISTSLNDAIGAEKASAFIKIPAKPRVKTIDSALGKIGRKGYTNPLEQMTDLVGVRFVVLLSVDIITICDIIESNNIWDCKVSKDYLHDIANSPKLFDYQSKHFEVRPKNEIIFKGVTITTDICCEVQVRTLLQHAYAELVHDSVYKPVGNVPKTAERQIARSMALMETTDELFCNTMNILANENKSRNDFLTFLISYYSDKVGEQYLKTDINVNYCLLDEFKEFIKNGIQNEIHELIEEKKYIRNRIISRYDSEHLFSQPSILFAYWLANNLDSGILLARWPLPGYLAAIQKVLSDLGKSSTR